MTIIIAHEQNKNRGSVFLVFEFMSHDLHGIIDSGINFERQHIKCIMRQVFEGIAHLHERAIIHRDIKGGNILLSREGVIKVADFGLARTFFPGQNLNYTNKVVTLWYRAPELILGMHNYTDAIDVWSLG